MPSVALVTFGCRVNQADSLELERDLRASGIVATDPSQADVVIVNTCSVTASADQGARQTIRRIHRDNASARIVVTGCYATRCSDEVAQLPGVCAVVPNDAKHSVAAQVRHWIQERSRDLGEGPCGAPIEPGMAGRTAWSLRVQTGCEEACSYCVIPTTRGRARSRPLDEVTREISAVAAAGFKEVAVTGVHLGSWGRDLSPRSSLAILLQALADHPADVTFRVSSLEPMDCTEGIRHIVSTHSRFAPHFHLPLQHASRRMLEAMARPYHVEDFAHVVGQLHASLPHASIGTDVMVGFPGESDEDHGANLRWLERLPLTHVHVFPYSDRPGTVASTLPGKVDGVVVRKRGEEIRSLGQRLAARFREHMVASARPGLTLEDGTLVVTDNYLKVRIPPGLPRNVRVRVRITSADPLRAELIP